jgi:GntR family transcriptional regulator/MocR family aminotransferase
VHLKIPVERGASAEPISRRIYQAIRAQILGGTLHPGETLPSTRELADHLSVSRTTTISAYELLLAEGFIQSRQGARTVVAEGTNPEPRPAVDEIPIRLSRFGEAAVQAGTEVPSRARGTAPLRYDFVYGRSAVEVFPFEAWRRLLLQKARKATLRTLDYGSANGSPALREAISTHLKRSRGVVCDASQVIVVNGSQQALDLTARVLLNPGDSVTIEDPHYQGAREVFRAAGAKLVPISVDWEGINPKLLDEPSRIVFTTPSHQFPTGTVLSLSRRLALLEWAKKQDSIIIEDDYDGEFHYEGQPVESMQGLDTEGRVVYMGTFSRTIFPALRIGYLIAPKSLVPAFTAAKWLCDRHTATLEQETLAEFISSGAYGRHLRRVRKLNALRRQALLAAIHELLGQRVDVMGEKSGTHLTIWPRRRRIHEKTIIDRAAERGVGVYGVAPYFYHHNGSRAGIILGFSRMNEHDIREGIRRLRDCGF